ncbi:MAG: cytochrome ubiquinol oxidase subunit I [Kofleriaceae bacterium]
MIDPPYPTQEFGPLMKGMVIGGVGILHVFLAQFAIGGGLLLAYLEHLRQRRGEAQLRPFIDSYFQTLVLVSFVLGAVTGVAMWLTTIQVGARTIGLMVDEFHWLWATEWLCFCIEVAAGYTFVRVGARLPDRLRLRLLVTYAVASWLSLFWINGILSWQLTPGAWLQGHGLWDGFFNPTFLPSLIFRTIVAMTLAALVGCLVIATLPAARLRGESADAPARAGAPGDAADDASRRRALVGAVSSFLAPMAAMPLAALWFLRELPEDSRGWVLGGSVAMTMFVTMAAGASAVIGVYASLLLLARRFASRRSALARLTLGGPLAAILLVLAFAATAAGEFVREGARKPYTVRGVLYSSSLTQEEVRELRVTGVAREDPWPLRDAARYPTAELAHGARVVRALCDACHTMKDANGLVHLVSSWGLDQLRHNLAALQHTKAFMPPFAGDARDVEAVVQLLAWERAGAPATWPPPAEPGRLAPADPLPQIRAWLDEAGVEPGGPRGAAAARAEATP